jgi:hypothetical protein
VGIANYTMAYYIWANLYKNSARLNNNGMEKNLKANINMQINDEEMLKKLPGDAHTASVISFRHPVYLLILNHIL